MADYSISLALSVPCAERIKVSGVPPPPGEEEVAVPARPLSTMPPRAGAASRRVEFATDLTEDALPCGIGSIGHRCMNWIRVRPNEK
jgi:hypothetical protein